MQFTADSTQGNVVLVAEFGNNAVGQFYLHRADATLINPTGQGTALVEWDLSPNFVTNSDNPASFFLNALPAPQGGGTSDVTLTLTQMNAALPVATDPGDDPKQTIANPCVFHALPPNKISRIDFSIYVQ